jgi:hypothetical protein
MLELLSFNVDGRGEVVEVELPFTCTLLVSFDSQDSVIELFLEEVRS